METKFELNRSNGLVSVSISVQTYKNSVKNSALRSDISDQNFFVQYHNYLQTYLLTSHIRESKNMHGIYEQESQVPINRFFCVGISCHGDYHHRKKEIHLLYISSQYNFKLFFISLSQVNADSKSIPQQIFSFVILPIHPIQRDIFPHRAS